MSTRPSIQSIINHMDAMKLIDHTALSRKQNKVLKDISECRTAALGFHEDKCENCGDTTLYYNSCRNSCCPQCMAVDRELWSMKEMYYSLSNIRYFHIIFTVPEELNPLFLLAPSFMYSLLFESVSSTMKTVAADPKLLGAQIGFTAVLHTWGQNLSLHPHIHLVVPGGGITSDGKWKNSKKKCFLPVRILSKVFRGKFLSRLKKTFDTKRLNDPSQLQSIIDVCYQKEWVVYAKKPFKSAAIAVKYLSRYTNRIAISNARIVSDTDDRVTFKFKDYKDHNRMKEMSLSEEEFMRRYIMHIPPEHFMRIRHYGFLASRNKDQRIKELRKLTNTMEPGPKREVLDKLVALSHILKRDVRICPHCQGLRHPQIE